MTDADHQRFEDLVNGPLNHPMYPFQMMRLIMALRHVVAVTGPAGKEALEEFCASKAKRDAEVDDNALVVGARQATLLEILKEAVATEADATRADEGWVKRARAAIDEARGA